jgi:hypothetical protein
MGTKGNSHKIAIKKSKLIKIGFLVSIILFLWALRTAYRLGDMNGQLRISKTDGEKYLNLSPECRVEYIEKASALEKKNPSKGEPVNSPTELYWHILFN